MFDRICQFGAYDSEGMKLAISPLYSGTLGLKTGCHGYFMLLRDHICCWVVYKVWNKLRYVINIVIITTVTRWFYTGDVRLIGFGAYDSEGMKLAVSSIYSATLGLKLEAGCHGYFMLLHICSLQSVK